MATLNDLLNEFGLAEETQTKTASQSKKTNNEVNKVLEDLGFSADEAVVEEVTKTASKGDSMSNGFMDDYEAIFGQPEEAVHQETEGAGEDLEKQASSEEGDVTDTHVFGELVGTYFNEMRAGFMEKIAGDLEAEAGAGHNPMPEHTTGTLSATIGQKGNPHLPVNRKAGEPLHVMTGNTSPYSLKGALAKQVLKRVGTSAAGDVGAYKE